MHLHQQLGIVAQSAAGRDWFGLAQILPNRELSLTMRELFRLTWLAKNPGLVPVQDGYPSGSV